MRRFIKILLLFVLVFLLEGMISNRVVDAKTSEPFVGLSKTGDLSLTVDCGTGGIIRCGRMLSLKVTIENNSPLKSGNLVVTALNNSSHQVAYTKSVDFTNEQRVVTEFVISLNQEVTALLITMSDQSGHIVVRKKLPIETVNYGEYLVVGLLSETPENLSYLQQFGVKTALLGQDSISFDYLCLDAFDAIVVDNFRLESLDYKQLTALEEWTAHGGTLILSGSGKDLSNIKLLEQHGMFSLSEEIEDRPAYYNYSLEIYSKEEKEIMDIDMANYQMDRLSMIKSIKENTEYNKFSHSYIGEAMDYKETDTSSMNGRNLYSFSVMNSIKRKESGNNVWLETVKYNRGIVEIFHFQLSMDCKEITQGQTALVHLMISFLSGTNKTRRWEEEMGYYNTFPTSDTKVLSSFSNIRIGEVFLFFLAYLGILGPVVFYFVKKKKKPYFLWLGVPIFALVCTGILVLLSQNTRVTQPYVRGLTIKSYEEDGTIYSTVYSSVIFPKRHNNSLYLAHTDAIYYGGFSYPPYYGGVLDFKESEKVMSKDVYADVNIIPQGDGFKLDLKEHPLFTEKQMIVTYENTCQKGAKGSGNVTYTGDSIKGTVINPFTQELRNSFLYYRGCYIDIGTLACGQALSVSGQDMVYYPCFNDAISAENFISQRYMDLSSTKAINQAILNGVAQIIDSKSLRQDRAYLIGTMEEVDSNHPLFETFKNRESCMGTIAVSEVALTTKENDTLHIFDLLDLSINKESFQTDYFPQYAYSQDINAVLRLPCNTKLKSINVSDLSCYAAQSEMKEQTYKKVYLYDFERARYDLFFDLALKVQTFQYGTEDLKAYVRDDGIIKVRYEGVNSPVGISEIPVISCSLEKIDAGN